MLTPFCAVTAQSGIGPSAVGGRSKPGLASTSSGGGLRSAAARAPSLANLRAQRGLDGVGPGDLRIGELHVRLRQLHRHQIVRLQPHLPIHARACVRLQRRDLSRARQFLDAAGRTGFDVEPRRGGEGGVVDGVEIGSAAVRAAAERDRLRGVGMPGGCPPAGSGSPAARDRRPPGRGSPLPGPSAAASRRRPSPASRAWPGCGRTAAGSAGPRAPAAKPATCSSA